VDAPTVVGMEGAGADAAVSRGRRRDAGRRVGVDDLHDVVDR